MELDGCTSVPRGAAAVARPARRERRARAARPTRSRARRLASRRGRRFPRSPARSRSCGSRGWRLAILSNTDPDLLAASLERSASRSTARSPPARSAPTSRRTGTGDVLRALRRRPGAGTCTSPRASSTTSRPRASSASRPSGSTGSAETSDLPRAAELTDLSRPRRRRSTIVSPASGSLRSMSRLRARCPDCRTLTAVALDGGEYECHSCGRDVRARGSCRVPARLGRRAARRWPRPRSCRFPYPEAAVVDEDTLTKQNLALAAALPERPLVLGGCCCAHVGAVEGLATRYDRLAVVWFDAHGDLNTPESSPSGNEWGMPLRMLLDSGTVRPDDGARRRAEPRPARGGVHRRQSACAPATRSSRSARGRRRRLRRASTWTSSTRRTRSSRSCRSRAAPRSSRRSHARAGSPPQRPRRRRRPHRPRPGARERRAARPLSSRARASDDRPRTGEAVRWRPWQSRIDVSVEHREAAPETTGSAHPNTCPRCHSHYRDDELEPTLRVCPQCGHHFPVRARERIAQLADRGTFVEEDAEPALGRPARLLRPARVHRAPRRGRGGDGARRRDHRRRGGDRAAALRARGHGLRLHGRLDGERRRREVRARLRARGASGASRSSA